MIDFFELYEGLNEAVAVKHDRYKRAHGKNASGEGMFMFTHKRSGEVDYDNEKEVHSASGKFADAAKSAKDWAAKNGHRAVYVMEDLQEAKTPNDNDRKKKYQKAGAEMKKYAAKNGGIDKKDFMAVADMLAFNGRVTNVEDGYDAQKILNRIMMMDTDVRDKMIDIVTKAFGTKMKNSRPSSKEIFAEEVELDEAKKYMVKYTGPDKGKSGKTTGPMSKAAAEKKAAMGNKVDKVGGKYEVLPYVEESDK